MAGLTLRRQRHVWQTPSLLLSSGKPNPVSTRFNLARLIVHTLFEVLCSCVEGFGVELPGGKAPHLGRVLALESPGARRDAGT